jgi:predicted site-specific integrase-resolvase
MNDNELLTLQEAATILRKHPRTLTRWHGAGLLRLIPLPKGYLIERSELDRFIAETDRMEKLIMQPED